MPDWLAAAPAEVREAFAAVMTYWNVGAFGVSYGRVITAACVLLVALLLRGLFARWIVRLIRIAASSTDTKADDILVEALAQPLKLVFLIIGLELALRVLSPPGEAMVFGARVVQSLIAIAVFWALHRLAGAMRVLLKPLAELLTPAAVEWLAKALQLIFLVVGGAAVLEIWGVRVAPLLAGLGIFGVAVALGAQDLFKNLIAGLAVLAEKRFHHGDWIRIDGVVEGVVEQINFRSTVVRRFDQGPVYVPNSVFSDSAVINFSRMDMRRIHWTIGLEYGTPLETMRRVISRIESYLRGNPNFVQPPEASLFVHFDEFNASSLDIMIYCFTKTTSWGEWLAIKEAFGFEVKRIVEEEGAAFAFPSRSIYLAKTPGGEKPERFAPPPEQAPAARPAHREAAVGGE